MEGLRRAITTIVVAVVAVRLLPVAVADLAAAKRKAGCFSASYPIKGPGYVARAFLRPLRSAIGVFLFLRQQGGATAGVEAGEGARGTGNLFAVFF